MLTLSTLLCSGVSCFGTHLAHNFLNNRCSMTILFNKERENCRKRLLAWLMMNFDWRYVLCIQKLYHRPYFKVGRRWNKSLLLQPLQRCFCENTRSPASACVMQHHYFNAVASYNKWFTSCGRSGKLTLWTHLSLNSETNNQCKE